MSQARQANAPVMWTSGEKMNYLLDIVTRFNQEQHTTASEFPDGTRLAIRIRLVSLNIGTMLEHLIHKLRDLMDFPADTSPPYRLSERRPLAVTVNFATGMQVFGLETTKELALSPVVIATYEEVVRAGKAQQTIGVEGAHRLGAKRGRMNAWQDVKKASVAVCTSYPGEGPTTCRSMWSGSLTGTPRHGSRCEHQRHLIDYESITSGLALSDNAQRLYRRF
jgi:hypothetical protein